MINIPRVRGGHAPLWNETFGTVLVLKVLFF